MLECALLLVLLFGLDLPYEADVWPLDEVVIQQIEEYAARHYREERNLQDAVTYEQGSVLRAETVFVGECQGDGPPATSRYGPCETSLFSTERCLKGEFPDTVLLHRGTGVMRGGMFNVPLGSRPIDWSNPEPGRRYLLLGFAEREDPEFLWGGFGHQRYELRDGIVVGKGVPENEFLGAVERLLSAAADSSAARAGSQGVDVQPPN